MIKIFKKINRFLRFGINLLVRLILALVYFILLFPFAIFIKLFADYLDIRGFKNPHWSLYKKVKNVEDFLRQQ